jgi:Ni/Co efflux regulator RcnB
LTGQKEQKKGRFERENTRVVEVALANLEQDYAREREHTLIDNKALWDEVHKERRRREEAGLMEDEPEETHWDKGTQIEDVILEQDLPPKKRRIQTEEESHEDRLECLG